MLDVRFVRKNLDVVRQALANRQMNLDLDQFVRLDETRRTLLAEVEALKNERNASSGEVAKLKRSGQDASHLMERLSAVSERIKILDEGVRTADEQSEAFLYSIPNVPHSTTPVGKDEKDNPVIRTVGDIPSLGFTPKEHWEIGQNLGCLDFERAAKITGSRFSVLWGDLARLERALVSFMMDIQTREHGYTEVAPPYIVNSDSLRGTGQLPKFEEDLFKLGFKDYYLIPTAEVPLTNLHRDETLEEADLPKAYCAYTPCFRSEAGSYGKDTKGLIRQHQFDKVELVRFCRPEESYEQLELLTTHAEEVLKRLNLPYRVIALCTGDLGFSSAKTYDIEVWLPGQNAYREISSCSNFEDFQARRAGIRFKPKGGKSQLAHTLNGSGMAVGRTMVALLENCQQADGSVVLPEALVPYMNGQSVLKS
ncbi:MAG: serine--tRNA ligase [Desulfovibrio sp.]|nr:serine--tRNA ligase [Desulfovibrio sp.]MBI4958874.1 serine--tRNA ligase [Desulfovibrio sp.]